MKMEILVDFRVPLKTKFHRSYILALFTSFSVVAAMLLIMAKLNIIFKVRMFKHLGISALTGKRVKGDDDSAIKEHLLFGNYAPDFEDFSISTNNTLVPLIESLLINIDHPQEQMIFTYS